MWNYRGQKRPDFAVEPGPGQESVWDYPRPPLARRSTRAVQVRNGDHVIARTGNSYRLLETASPPTFYLPPESVDWDSLITAPGNSVCEWKGAAEYFALPDDPAVPVAWRYPRPRARFEMLRNYVSFYPGRVECYVDDARVVPQAGGFYGGWITADVVGPFKGDPGTGHW